MPGFAIGRLQVQISAGTTLHQGLLSLTSLRGLGRQRQVWLISLVDEMQGVQVRLCYPLTMRAISERLRDVEEPYKSTTFTFTVCVRIQSNIKS